MLSGLYLSYGSDYIEKLRNIICDRLSIKNDEWVKELCKNVWDISHLGRGGACFLVADLTLSKKGENVIASKGVKMTEVFPFAEGRRLLVESGRSIFQELAIQDGATFIDTQSSKVFGRRQLGVDMTIAKWDKCIIDLKSTWEDHHKLLRWGTRHLNALRAALYFKGKALLITVSSDGEIHLFDKNGPVKKAMYPA